MNGFEDFSVGSWVEGGVFVLWTGAVERSVVRAAKAAKRAGHALMLAGTLAAASGTAAASEQKVLEAASTATRLPGAAAVAFGADVVPANYWPALISRIQQWKSLSDVEDPLADLDPLL